MSQKKGFKSSAQRRAVMSKLGGGLRYNPNARLTGKTTKRVDKRILAKPAGKRVSDSGNIYFERRANRADRSRTARL